MVYSSWKVLSMFGWEKVFYVIINITSQFNSAWVKPMEEEVNNDNVEANEEKEDDKDDEEDMDDKDNEDDKEEEEEFFCKNA